MTSREFCYWLQGFFEMGGPVVSLNPTQIQMIKNHLDLVFVHEIDPSYPNGKKLQAIHDNLVKMPDFAKNAPVMRC